MISLFFLACNGGNETSVNRILPNMALASSSIEFGEVTVGETATESLQIINAGPGLLRITDLDIGSIAYGISPMAADVEAGAILDLQIDFSPTDYEDYESILTISSNDEESPSLSIPVAGIGGDGPQPDLVSDTLALDFGDVAIGEEKVLYFTVQNAGDEDLQIGTTTQSGSGAFSLVGDLDNSTLAPGVSSSILVSYNPVQPAGESGSLSIPSNDPGEPTVHIGMTGNGGGDLSYPEASINCPSEVSPPSQIELDGSGSTDPDGTALSYIWSIVELPVGSSAGLSATDEVATVLEVDLAGNYQINLVVENEAGLPSAPAECIFYAEPPSDIHVELSWSDTDADLDLHLLRSEDGFFLFEDDCCWCNKTPDWGGSGAGDDPALLFDSEDNSQPEAIDLVDAPDGSYYMRVHYFTDSGAGQSNATIRVYIEGVLESQYSQQMLHNQVWDVGFIRWPESYLIDENTAPYAYEGTRSCH
jgi:hypothetical protein